MEADILQFFRKAGYHVQPTSLSGDYCADIILIKTGIRTAVQAKMYSGHVGYEQHRNLPRRGVTTAKVKQL